MQPGISRNSEIQLQFWIVNTEVKIYCVYNLWYFSTARAKKCYSLQKGWKTQWLSDSINLDPKAYYCNKLTHLNYFKKILKRWDFTGLWNAWQQQLSPLLLKIWLEEGPIVFSICWKGIVVVQDVKDLA